MDCGDDGGGLDDLVELATNIANSAPTIRGNIHFSGIFSILKQALINNRYCRDFFLSRMNSKVQQNQIELRL